MRTLRARERLPQLRPTEADGRFPIATLDEIIDLVATESAKRGRVIGLVPEIKHPTYFTGIGLPMEEKLLSALSAHAYTQQAPVTIQSFETGNLRFLRERMSAAHPNLRLLQLLGGQQAVSYTHLDVYKRQAEQFARAGDKTLPVQLDALHGMVAHLHGSEVPVIDPVSYTHLGVYNIQDRGRAEHQFFQCVQRRQDAEPGVEFTSAQGACLGQQHRCQQGGNGQGGIGQQR